MIVYIAGPMTGLPDYNFPAFKTAEKALRALGYDDVRSPHKSAGGTTDKPYEYYLRLALRMLLECDAIVLLPGWENSRGATLEWNIAQALNMSISSYDNVLLKGAL